jgi:hypothetical protein
MERTGRYPGRFGKRGILLMIPKIYKKEKETNKTVYFTLAHISGENAVELTIVDEDGRHLGCVASINRDGTMSIHKGLKENLGLRVNGCGQIIVNF